MQTNSRELLQIIRNLTRRIEALEAQERGPRNNFSAAVAPAVTDDLDLGYKPGSLWVDVAADDSYQCQDNTNGAAVWAQID